MDISVSLKLLPGSLCSPGEYVQLSPSRTIRGVTPWTQLRVRPIRGDNFMSCWGTSRHCSFTDVPCLQPQGRLTAFPSAGF